MCSYSQQCMEKNTVLTQGRIILWAGGSLADDGSTVKTSVPIFNITWMKICVCILNSVWMKIHVRILNSAWMKICVHIRDSVWRKALF